MYELSIGRCTNAIVLCKQDGSTDWWDRVTAWDPEAIPMYEPLAQPPDLWIFKKRIQFDEHPELVARRVAEYQAAKALYDAGRGPKPKGSKRGKSSNNFSSVIIHHRGVRDPMLDLHDVATPWMRAS